MTEIRYPTFHARAAVDLTSFQYCAMSIDTAGAVQPILTGAGQQFAGVLQNANVPVGGWAELILIGGVSWCVASGSGSGIITPGDNCNCVSGTAGKFTRSATSGNIALAYALTGATAGNLFLAVLQKYRQ